MKQRFYKMTILIVAEHEKNQLQPSLYNLVYAVQELKKEASFDANIEVALFGDNCQNAVDEAANIEGVNQVVYFQSNRFSHLIAEDIAPLLQEKATSYTHIIFPSSTFGKNLMPRVAGLLDIAPLSDVIGFENDQFIRPIYAGNAIAYVKLHEETKLLTIRPTAFDKARKKDDSSATEMINVTDISQDISTFVSCELSEAERPELTSANIVVSGGRGMQNKENFSIIEALADKLGAAVGASRAAVDAGFVPNDYQVGQTGKVVAPDLYIAIGISGAIQHLAGMKDSKTIVAINKDEDAPIFQIADYGLVGDLFDIVPELMEKL